MNELTDEQRQLIQAFFEENPDGGYKSACKAAGIHATKAEAKQLIDGDDELAECREKALGVDQDSALRRIAILAKNLEHKDSFRANTFIVGALHGISEQARVQVAGDPDNPIGVTAPDVEQAVERFTAAVAAAAVRHAPTDD